MRGFYYYWLLLPAVTLFLTGCSSVTQTIYLQNVDVSGPLNQPPIVVVSHPGSTFTVSPRFSYNGRKYLSGNVDSHSTINENNIYQIDTVYNPDGTRSYKISDSNIYEFKGDNLTWNLPQVTAGLDMDIQLSKAFAVTGGLSYSSDKSRDYFGGQGEHLDGDGPQVGGDADSLVGAHGVEQNHRLNQFFYVMYLQAAQPNPLFQF